MSKPNQIDISSRKELARYFEYQPGLSIDHMKRQYGLSKVIKVASNENPFGPSPKGMAAFKRTVDQLHRYPDSKCIDLRRLLAGQFFVPIDQVVVGAGSDEIIELLAKAYLTSSDDIVVSTPSFLQYKIAADLMGANVIQVPLKNEKYDLDGILKAIKPSTKFVFFANPNNPTGTYVNKEDLGSFLKDLPKHVLPVIDEAYFEYASYEANDYPDAYREFRDRYPLMVLRTFSKAFGLAGLRVGYGIGPENIISQLLKIKPPFNVSIPAQAAAAAALEDKSFISKSIATNKKEKEKLVKALTGLGFRCVPSVTNFILFEVSPFAGRTLFERLLQKGVVARAVDEYGLRNFLRVSVGTPAENKIFLQAIQEVVKQK